MEKTRFTEWTQIKLLMIVSASRSQDLSFGRAAEGIHRGMAQTEVQGGRRPQETQGEASQAKGKMLPF